MQSIFIYALTFLNPEDNWLEAIGKEREGPISKYIKSMYFIATTMFTVGYGDVLPRNYIEISVIILVQLLGNSPLTQASSSTATSSTRSGTSCRPSATTRRSSSRTSRTRTRSASTTS